MSRLAWKQGSAAAWISQGLVVHVAVTLLNIAAGIITARVLGPAGRGDLAAFTTLPVFFSTMVTLGLPSALVFEARRDSDAIPSLLPAALMLSLVAALLGIVGAWLSAPLVLRDLSETSIVTARWLSICLLPTVIANVAIAALQGLQRFGAYNAVRLAQPALQLTLLLALSPARRLTPTLCALVTLLSGVPALLWSIAWLVRACRPRWSGFAAASRRLYSYGARAYAAEVLIGLAGQIDRVIVVGVFAPAILGLYVVYVSLARVVAIVPAAVVAVLFPRASGRTPDEVLRVTARAGALTVAAVGSLGVALLAAGPWLLRLFYGPDFVAEVVAFRLLVLEAAVSSVVYVLSQAFMALNRPGLCSIQYGLGAGAAAALLLLLSPRYGLVGAAVALLAASLVRAVFAYVCFVSVLRTGVPRILNEIGAGFALVRQRALALRRA